MNRRPQKPVGLRVTRESGLSKTDTHKMGNRALIFFTFSRRHSQALHSVCTLGGRSFKF